MPSILLGTAALATVPLKCSIPSGAYSYFSSATTVTELGHNTITVEGVSQSLAASLKVSRSIS